MAFGNIYRNKTVLITGHAGFKGGWLAFWLKQLGAKVVGYSLYPDSSERFYDVINLKNSLDAECIADIRDSSTLEQFFTQQQPDIVFHLAAQPLVRLSYEQPVETYETNVIGTLKVLEAARKIPSVKAFVNVTTDKCYENKEKSEGYKESDPFGGYDIYSSSKACSEILSSSYRRSFLSDNQFLLATARGGNVIGGGDWAKDRLVPDCIKAFMNNESVYIRNPSATRPWQLVFELLAGYLRLGQMLLEGKAQFADGFNFGPEMNTHIPVADIVRQIADIWGSGKIEIDKSVQPHEAHLLQLDITKAQKMLGFMPVYSTKEAVAITTQWYKAYYAKNTDMIAFSLQQLNDFIKAAQAKDIMWSISDE